MAKRSKKTAPTGDNGQKRPPSRENTRYLALPRNLYEALERYAEDNSEEGETKSISWAGRRAVRKFLKEEGYLDTPPRSGSPAKSG